MKHVVALSAVFALALAGCGGGDDDDSSDAGDAGSDWCQTVLAVDEELTRLEEDIESEDFYEEVAEAYQRLADGAPDDLADDFDRVIEGFEAFNEWLQDPTGDYPLSDEEDAAYTASIDRINVVFEEECGIDIDDSDDFDDTGADSSGADEFTDDESDDEVTMEIETEDGSGDVSLGGELPEDFPLPTPASYRVGSSMAFDESGAATYVAVLHVPQDDFDAVADLYEAFLDDEGFEVTKTDMSSSDVDRFMLLSGVSDDVIVDIVLSIEEVANDADGNLVYETTVSLSWSEQPDG